MVRVSPSIHPLNVLVHNPCFCYCSGNVAVTDQISLLPVFSCDARISTWKGQDQGQSLAVCLWIGKTHTFHPWINFDEWKLPIPALVRLPCVGESPGNIAKMQNLIHWIWSEVWDSAFATSPRCCWSANPRTMFWAQSIRALSWKGIWGNISAQWESVPWFISNVCHERGASFEYMPLCPTNLCWKWSKTVERICYPHHRMIQTWRWLYIF